MHVYTYQRQHRGHRDIAHKSEESSTSGTTRLLLPTLGNKLMGGAHSEHDDEKWRGEWGSGERDSRSSVIAAEVHGIDCQT